MGIHYSEVYLPVRCPQCGTVAERRCVTKELGMWFEMKSWKVGDSILAGLPEQLHCYADCRQPSCMGTRVYGPGKSQDWPFFFTVVVKLDNGVITGEHEVTKEDPEEE
jgi:hypothetical protein